MPKECDKGLPLCLWAATGALCVPFYERTKDLKDSVERVRLIEFMVFIDRAFLTIPLKKLEKKLPGITSELEAAAPNWTGECFCSKVEKAEPLSPKEMKRLQELWKEREGLK